MQTQTQIADGVVWVGTSDRRLERFENMHPLVSGMAYNAYVITGEKTALLDTVDAAVVPDFLDRVALALGDRALDYLVVHHAEPDHGAAVMQLLLRYPALKIVASQKAKQLLEQFHASEIADDRFVVVAEGDTLDLGGRSLRFFAAPMVHWPEVMMSFEPALGILFSADAFGAFGALSGNVFADELDFEPRFLGEMRRYYANIVGKYGPQVQAVLKKLPLGDIKTICPLHGPVFRKDLDFVIGKYDVWSRYEPEQRGVVIAYGSMYGNTKQAATLLAESLARRGIRNIHMHDISKTHASYVISNIYKYSHLVVAAPTYNNSLYVPMQTLLHDMITLGVQNRDVSIIANGSWAPRAHTLMRELLDEMKDMRALGEPFVVTSALKPAELPQLEQLAETLAASVLKQ